MASKTTAAGSDPSLARTMSTPARRAQISSCSTAAARNVSAAQISGWLPSLLSRLASFPTVVVLPVPFTPTTSVTCGRCPFDEGASTLSNTCRISSLTRSRRLSPFLMRCLTAVTIRSVAAMPTSAETRISSSASIVSTATGRVRCSTVSACSTISSNRSTICCFVRLKPSRKRSRNPKSQTPHPKSQLAHLCALRTQHQILERRARVFTPRQQFVDLCGNRQLDADTCRQRQRGLRRPHALCHHLHSREHVVQGASMSQLDADVPVAAQRSGTCQDQIAEAGEAGHRFAAGAGGAGQARDLGQPTRDQPGARVVAKTETFDDAGGNGDDVLERSSDLHANDIVGAIQPEIRRSKLRLHALDDILIRRC